ncbi:MAG: hypothetical protein ABJA66_11790 [Actinomycetota bacterium]
MIVNVVKIIFFVSFIGILASCNVQNKTDRNDFANFSPTPSVPKVYQKDDGSLVKDEGWLNPDFQIKNKKYLVENAKTEDGRKVKILSSEYFPTNEILIQFPLNPAESEKSETRVVGKVNEFKGKNQPPFCYLLSTARKQGPYVAFYIKFYLCDMNGDGIFETIPQGIMKMPVPVWVK